MAEIYLLRHGIAEEPGPNFPEDSKRPLTSEGRKKMRKIGESMARLGLDECAMMLSSPYVRARETAEIVHKALGARMPLGYSKNLVPNGSLEDLILEIHSKYRTVENIILVGHEPFMSAMISTLICGKETAGIQMKKGGLCKLSYERLICGSCALLSWLLTPKCLMELGRD